MTGKFDPTAGDRVVLCEARGRFRGGRVERVTKRDIVLEDGRRFSRATLREHGGSTWSWVSLHSPDEPYVVRGLKKQAREDVRAKARQELAQADEALRFDRLDQVRGSLSKVLDLVADLAEMEVS